MTKLPATLIEAEARQHARGYLRKLLEGPWDSFQIEYAPLDPRAGRAVARRFFRWACETPQLMTFIVELADRYGERDAYDALMEIRDERIERNEPLGAVLGAYVIKLRTYPFRPHGRRDRNVVQDICLVMLVVELVERFDLKPTRSQKDRPSGCSIAAEEAANFGLNRGSEEAFQQLWKKYSPHILEGYAWPNRGRRGAL
jgi:hypothetical protein